VILEPRSRFLEDIVRSTECVLFQRSACRVPDIAPCDGLNLLLGVLQSGGNVLDEQVGSRTLSWGCLDFFFQREKPALRYVGTRRKCFAPELHARALRLRRQGNA
jgi:hypothetical protein